MENNPYKKQPVPDAPSPMETGSLLAACTHVVYMGYIGVSGSKAKAMKVAEKVLKEVERFYLEAAAQEGLDG